MTREFDDRIRLAADALVERKGIEDAIAELNMRRVKEPRAAEALAYVKRHYSRGLRSDD